MIHFTCIDTSLRRGPWKEVPNHLLIFELHRHVNCGGHFCYKHGFINPINCFTQLGLKHYIFGSYKENIYFCIQVCVDHIWE